MKQLYIVRHSKAVEYADDHTDFNRCLAHSGIEKATLIADHLAAKVNHIDAVLSSPACRALETARIFSTAMGFKHSEIKTDDVLYHFGGIDPALNTVASVEDHINGLMLFGHNPTFSNLAWKLCNSFREGMPTSAVVGLEFDIQSWGDIYAAKGDLLFYLTKKNLGQ